MEQTDFAYRFEWGLEGLRTLAPLSNVVIIVDVLRFSSAVCAALESGASVFPYPWRDDQAHAYAAANKAVLAGWRENGELSLSPTDLLSVPFGTRIVLPSPNGSTLAFEARALGVPVVLAGSLRNATATARFAVDAAEGGVISVIAAGERWHSHDGPVRCAVEDMLGAGAILTSLDPSVTPGDTRCSLEASAARAVFLQSRSRLLDELKNCGSGRELIKRGWEDDVATSAAIDVAAVAALLVDNEFVARRIVG